MSTTVHIAARSAAAFAGLVIDGEIKLHRQRLGNYYSIDGNEYSIFRETQKLSTVGEPVTLVIGFRLKLIRSVKFLHWLFQRICVLTTPFWSGLKGFKINLWMVDPVTNNYIGIYDWRGINEASRYVTFLLPILTFFSVKGSVWAKQLNGQNMEQYLTDHAA